MLIKFDKYLGHITTQSFHTKQQILEYKSGQKLFLLVILVGLTFNEGVR
jgi:hypothetical protein